MFEVDENTNEIPKSSWLGTFVRKRIQSRDSYMAIALFVFCLVTIFYLIPYHVEIQHAKGMAVKPNFFPYAVSFFLVFLSIILFFNSHVTSRDVSRREDKQINSVTVLFLALLFGCYLGIYLIGMVPAGILIIFILVRVFGYKRWLLTLIFAVAFVIILYLFFERIAQVNVPRGILFEDWY